MKKLLLLLALATPVFAQDFFGPATPSASNSGARLVDIPPPGQADQFGFSVLTMSQPLMLPTAIFAQATPATPLVPPPTGTPTTTAPGTPKAKPLDAGDKKFVKDSLDGMFYVMDLVGKAKNNAKAETTKKLASSLKTDLDKIWEAVGAFATERGEKVPTELSGGDKGKAERVAKSKDKFDKEFTKVVSKEVERLAKVFETAGKSGQDATVKELGTNWAPTLKDHAIKAEAAEKEAMKAN